MNLLSVVEQGQIKPNIPRFKPGDTVRVHVKIQEGDKFRIQVYEGLVIALHRNGAGSTFTVRKISFGYGVERIFPWYSPVIDKIEIVKSGKVRHAKLYYLRGRKGKAARLKEVRAVAKPATEPKVDKPDLQG
ncbi:MAG: 50S ribosomal protein L19 [Acidobacteria bacterium]|nr:50S ribosomal protein L19 [Acidobacteriota bacterium]MBI3658392.1 50S ribosomal protein L19 [Acidobacteriota bacterium]